MFPTTLDPSSEIDFETVSGLVFEGSPCSISLSTARAGVFSLHTEAIDLEPHERQPRVQMRQREGILHVQIKSSNGDTANTSSVLGVRGLVPEGVSLAVRQPAGKIDLKGDYSRIRADCAQLSLSLSGTARELVVTGQNAALNIDGRVGDLSADLNSASADLRLGDMQKSDRLQLKARVLAAKIGVPPSIQLAQDIDGNVLAFKSGIPPAADAAALMRLHSKVLSGKIYRL
ncbi:hypothetical protein [Labrenzia sp. VG12]|uniref:hypothetical protein n=1 Tax=Labrenzia sp. VG12 TaxID=2021862 RepID=UPI000B8BC778|nr:hypothetical protein [Labrenzia sp. VG12]ASP33199.1 hypothetical protein CHH27_08020 [Labrenzia sp. VG12]